MKAEEGLMYKEELHGLIEKRQVNVCQICAYKNNQKVYSDSWNNYKEDDGANIMSVTKSIMALLIGIAVDKGKIKSIDDNENSGKMTPWIPVNSSRGKSG